MAVNITPEAQKIIDDAKFDAAMDKLDGLADKDSISDADQRRIGLEQSARQAAKKVAAARTTSTTNTSSGITTIKDAAGNIIQVRGTTSDMVLNYDTVTGKVISASGTDPTSGKSYAELFDVPIANVIRVNITESVLGPTTTFPAGVPGYDRPFDVAASVSGQVAGIDTDSIDVSGFPIAYPGYDRPGMGGSGTDTAIGPTTTFPIDYPGYDRPGMGGAGSGKFSSVDEADGRFGGTAKPLKVSNDTQPEFDPIPNVLHNYSSFTYRLTWGAQSITDHRITQQAGHDIGVPQMTEILMTSGGGRVVDGVSRSDIFGEDFFIEDLRIPTIIGTPDAQQGANSVSIEFSVIEPYAVSLIERLLALANRLGIENYIEIPYVLKIEFIGYKDDGESSPEANGHSIPNTTKYIPFRLTTLDFSVIAHGSKYAMTGIPMSHMALNATVAALPTPVEVKAGNIGRFFKSGATGNNGSRAAGLVDIVNDFNKTHNRHSNGGPPGQLLDDYDEIDIILDPKLAASILETENIGKIGMQDIPANSKRNYGVHGIQRTYGFNAGTTIPAIINSVISNSKYYTDQLEKNKLYDELRSLGANGPGQNPELDSSRVKNPPIDHFKITTTYEMKEYNAEKLRHAYKATYHVTRYAVPATPSNITPLSRIENVAKEYNYWFTGKNYDILDLDIRFNLAYYNNITNNSETAGNGTKSTATQKKGTRDVRRLKNNDSLNKKTNEMTTGNQTGSAATMTGTTENPKKLKAVELHRSIMQDSVGDMITFDMTILGDPSWIKQDDILYRVSGKDAIGPTGSLKQDNGDVYVRLKFKVFDDIDHGTGLRQEARQIPDAQFKRKSTFDGFYKVMMLESIFDQGVFTQNLVMVRSAVQADEDAEVVKELKSQNVTVRPDGTGALPSAGNLGGNNIEGQNTSGIADNSVFAGEGGGPGSVIVNVAGNIEGQNTSGIIDNSGFNGPVPLASQNVTVRPDGTGGVVVTPLIDINSPSGVPLKTPSTVPTLDDLVTVTVDTIADISSAIAVNIDKATSFFTNIGSDT